MKKIIALGLLLFVFLHIALAQKVTVSGTVTDANSGEQIMGAYVILVDTANPSNPQGCVSNKAGFYSISVFPGAYQFKVSFMGFMKPKDVDSKTSVWVGLRPGIKFAASDKITLVAHLGSLGYKNVKDTYSQYGLNIDNNGLSLGLYWSF